MKSKKLLLFAAAAALAAAALCIAWINREPRWFITQYADVTGLQAMFYTLESDKGDLIVVDGGNTGNADYVRKIIEEKGGHVDAWFLTHPHPDHIGAFNLLWEELQDAIDVIYTTDIDYEIYHSTAQEWDDIEGYDIFLNYMTETDKLNYLYTGDELEVCGLRIQIFHSYEDFVGRTSNNVGNDSSLIIKITNRRESMLFCGDTGAGMSDRIIERYGSEIKCDYIQMGHHGNGGLSEGFYRLASPRAAFFDAPEWLMNPEEGKNFTTPANRQLMESLGAEVYDYSTAPNRIELR